MTQTFCMTIGDPTGIGPEIMAKVLVNTVQMPSGSQMKIIGDIPQLNEVARQLGVVLPHSPRIEYLHIEGKGPGAVSYLALEKAVELIAHNEADALVTGPISKENLKSVGIPFEGHTEILQHLSNLHFAMPDKARPGEGWQSDMLFVFEGFRMLLLTRHVALKDVSNLLTEQKIAKTLGSAIRFIRQYEAIASPHVCVLGVNPHAGEINGSEERDTIMPALEAVSREYGVPIEPPCAADALFRGFNITSPEFDLYVASYHDQGLIPMKLLAGFKAVNVTIGLPFIRTSVSHGMASDIVDQGVANPESLQAALNLASDLLLNKKTNQITDSAITTLN